MIGNGSISGNLNTSLVHGGLQWKKGGKPHRHLDNFFDVGRPQGVEPIEDAEHRAVTWRVVHACACRGRSRKPLLVLTWIKRSPI